MSADQFLTLDGRPTVRVERRYPHPIEKVWQAVTAPEHLKQWFPSPVKLDLQSGGAMRFGAFTDAYNWDTSEGVHVQSDLMSIGLPPLVAQSTVTVTGIIQNVPGIGPVVFPYDPAGIVTTSSLAG